MKLLRKLIWICFLAIVALALIALGYYFAVTKNVALREEKLLFSNKNFTVYAADMQPISASATFTGKQTVPIVEIPQKTRLAFVDTEDKRFFAHGGFDIKRIGKAILNNAKAKSFKEGASTISQQLIKNTHLSQEKTLKRKLQEWKLTRALEKKYTKDEILEKYLNTIYFGHNCFGLRAASEFYFGKKPNELTLADSAILAGLVKSPNNYSPFKNPENCIKRKRVVLNAMLQNGDINKTEYTQALNAPLPTPNEQKYEDAGFLHFVFDELTDIAESANITLGGKVEIFTYLDVALQREIEKQAAEIKNADKCILALDGNSGGFKACVSSIGNIPRLPGSLIKPLLVYAPALEENMISPVTPILDEKVNYRGYSPENYDKQYHGYVSTRECVEKSLNVPAVKILQSIGVKKGVGYLNQLGLNVESGDETLALALGGMRNGFCLRDLVAAYASLQNHGVYKSCNFIDKIKVDGVTVYTRKISKSKVFSEDTAYLMTDMLKTTAQKGTAKKLRTLPFDVAAKTGTVGTEHGNTDAYALSYTAKDCIAVWIGNANNSYIDYTGGGLPCNLLLRINEYIYADYLKKNITLGGFVPPTTIKRVDLDKPSYYDTHTILQADPISPAEYRFSEVFKTQAIPAKKSDFFSNPSIFTPTVSYAENTVTITFDKRCPTYYTYKIDRYDYVTHNTLYCGDFIPVFTDTDIAPNHNYVYTVTPIYKENIGQTITLPTVSAKNDKESILKEKEILTKDWWEY